MYEPRSTPDDKLKSFLQKKEGNRKQSGLDKKKDVYLYNFFLHKPKYVYTTEENRMKKKEDHYGQFANKADFKNNLASFFAVENEFPKPDYNRRGPIQRPDDAMTLNRVYGGKVPVHL